MLQTILPVISECVIAFDLSLNQYITIGPCIGMLAGYNDAETPDEANFWYPVIHPADLAKVKEADNGLKNGQATTISYRIIPTETNSYRYITERRSKYADSVTGHYIIFSILNEHSPSVIDSEEGAKADALQREQFLLSLVNSQTNFLIRLNRAGQYTFVNNTYCQALGFAEDELIGEHFSINTPPDEMALCEAAFIKCLNNPGQIIPLTKDKVSKTGERHPSEWEFISIINERKEVVEIQGIGRDISQRIEIETQIKKANQNLDNFIESITDAFFILDNDWRFVKTNSALETMTRRTRDQLIGNKGLDVYPTVRGTLLEEQLKQAEKSQLSRHFTTYLPITKLWVRITIYPSAEGLAVFIKNINEQKKAEEELNWTRSNLESLINNTKDHIWSIDSSMSYMYANVSYKDAVFSETGVTPLRGEPVVIFGTADVQSAWQGYYKRALGGERFDVVYEHHNSVTNDVEYHEIGFNPIYNSEHEVTGMGCFARDVTQHFKHENEIISQNERLRHIASISSHELRRPVASMLGLINIIDFENFNNPENKETISHLLTVGQEIDVVIRLIVDNAFGGNTI